MQNKEVNIVSSEILSNNWYTLRKYTYDISACDGSVRRVAREAYDRGNGATILLYNLGLNKVVLTRQFRLPTFINGNESGMLIETCAGLLDDEDAETCIVRETEEETGYRITHVKKIFEAYMSPGSVTEILYFYIAEFNSDMKTGPGGGVPDEHENIEVLEIDIDVALHMIGTGEIKDAKTIMLLYYMKLHLL